VMGPTAADFEWFFAAEHVGVVRALAMAFGDRQAAEDAAQEGFSQALAQWGKVARMEHPVGWVYTVAVRYERRRAQRSLRHPAAERERPPDEAQGVADRVLLAELLRTLTPRQRQAVVLRYHADLSVPQIAQALGCSTGTVKATLHQAVARLGVTAGKDHVTDANR
jgi:RNA polymerase sigma-70 factor, ECF subfamily